jgi:hypothetical protein
MDRKTIITGALAAAIGATGVSLVPDEPTFVEIAAQQEAYYKEHGRYEQVPCDGRKYCVHVYESVDGHGYQIVQEEPNARIELGYGPQADRYTDAALKTATTTGK